MESESRKVSWNRTTTTEESKTQGSGFLSSNDLELASSSASSNPFDFKRNQTDSLGFNKAKIQDRTSITIAGTYRRSGRLRNKQTTSRVEVVGHKDDKIRNSVTLIKTYGLLKAQLQRCDAASMSKILFPDDSKLTADIDTADKRRKAVDILLKKVLEGSEDMHARFIEALKTGSNNKLIIDNLDVKQVTDSDINVYRALNVDRKQSVLPERRLEFSKNDYETLKGFLNNEEHIDKINNELLSRFIFTVEQHSNITDCDIKGERKVILLLDTLTLLDKNKYENFRQILASDNVKLDNILMNLEQEQGYAKQTRKRVHIPGTDSDTERSYGSKKFCLSKDVQVKVVRENNKPETPVKRHFNEMGMKVEEARIGSIILEFKPEESNSWENLKQLCREQRVSELILSIFDSDDIHKRLPDGQFNIKLAIYQLYESSSGFKNGKLVLENATETTDKDMKKKHMQSDQIQNIPDDPASKVLLEELDLTDDLLSHLKSNKIVSKNIDDEIAKQQRRENKVACLLQEVRQHGQEGYDVLIDYIEHKDPRLYKQFVPAKALTDMDTAVKNIPTDHKERQKRTRQKEEEFFTCDIVLEKRTEEAVEGASRGEVRLYCPRIFNIVEWFNQRDDTNMNEGLDMEKKLRSDTGSPDRAKKTTTKQSEKTVEAVKDRRSTLRSSRRQRQKRK